MKKYHVPRSVISGRLIGGLPISLLIATSTAHASEPSGELEPIETALVVPVEVSEYPDPICLGCKIVTKRSTTDDDEGGGVLVIEYEGVLGEAFVGSIVFTVLLPSSGRWRSVTLDGVLLLDGQTTTLDVPAGTDWCWHDVGTVMVQMNEA